MITRWLQRAVIAAACFCGGCLCLVMATGCAGYKTTQMAAGEEWAAAEFFDFGTGVLEVVVPTADGEFAVRWHGIKAKLSLPVLIEPEWDAPAAYTLGPPEPSEDVPGV